jgi:hypothetical protein
VTTTGSFIYLLEVQFKISHLILLPEIYDTGCHHNAGKPQMSNMVEVIVIMTEEDSHSLEMA